MLRQTFLLLSLALFVPATGLAQLSNAALPPASPNGRTPANDALSISLGAHGGGPLLQIQTIQLKGTSTGRNGEVQPLKVSASLDGSTRIDWGSPVKRSLVNATGRRFEVVDGTIKSRPAHSALYGELDILGVLALRSTSGVGRDRGVIGNGELSGRTSLRIRAGTDNRRTFYVRPVDDELDVVFDHQTGLVAAIHRAGHADESFDRKFVRSYVFSDYRELPFEIHLPFRIAHYLDGQLIETIAVDSYEFNPAFAADVFQR